MSATAVFLSLALFSHLGVCDTQEAGNSSVQKQDEPIVSKAEVVGGTIGAVTGWIVGGGIGIATGGAAIGGAPVCAAAGAVAGAWIASKLAKLFDW